ncbi:MAG: GNAT family N-acetyltransferase [Lentilitoribacter sp.]
MDNALDIRIIDIWSSLERWRGLEHNAVMSPYQYSAWILAWYNDTEQNLKSDRRVFAVEGWQEDNLVFILPLQITNVFGIKICKWLGPKYQNLNSGIFSKHWLTNQGDVNFSEVLSQIAELHGDIDIFQLEKQPLEIGSLMNPLAGVGHKMLHPDPIYIAKIDSNFKNWEESKRSKNSRKRLAKKRNALQRIVGSVTIQRVTSSAEVNNAFDTLFSQREQARKTRALPNPVSEVSNLSALKEAAIDGLNSHNGLRVYTMNSSASVLAVNCFITHDERASAILSSMDENLAKFSVGRLIERDTLELLIIDRFSVVDFGLGDDRYKMEWAIRERLYDNFVASTHVGHLARHMLVASSFFKQMIKRPALVKKVIRFVKSRYRF